MSRKQKWLDADGDQPINQAAGGAIQSKLTSVLDRLPLAAEAADETIEHVHQLRVATRRAQIALRLFADSLPRRRRRWWTRQLKRIRDAASRARDLDVLILRLAPESDQDEAGPLHMIVQDLQRQREAAQAPLCEAHQRSKDKHYRRKLDNLIEQIGWRGEGDEPRFGCVARQTLEPLVDAFFVAGAADLTNPQQLHQMRIAGKKLRYAIELLASAFDGRLRDDLYPQFTQIQEDLGQINDHVVAKNLFDGWLVQSDQPATDEELARLIMREQLALQAAMDGFHKDWTTQVAQQMHGKFRALLELPLQQRSVTSQTPTSDSDSAACDRLSGLQPMDSRSSSSAPGREIERKFLIAPADVPDRLDRYPHDSIQQGYLVIGATGEEVRVRRKDRTGF